jgi:hypothetical protein
MTLQYEQAYAAVIDRARAEAAARQGPRPGIRIEPEAEGVPGVARLEIGRNPGPPTLGGGFGMRPTATTPRSRPRG